MEPTLRFAKDNSKVLGKQAQSAMKHRDYLIDRGCSDSSYDVAQAQANMDGALDVYPGGETKRPDLTDEQMAERLETRNSACARFFRSRIIEGVMPVEPEESNVTPIRPELEDLAA